MNFWSPRVRKALNSLDLRHTAALAFFFSGASSLIFQSIWSRLLVHVFGAGSAAISTTVTVFMAGLGLGAFLAGRYADRIKHPVIAYAVVEALVGVWALMLPSLVDPEGWLAGVNSWLRNDLGAESVLLMHGARFLCILPILLVPTTLMGTSLPLLARHFVQRSEKKGDVSAWVGALYSINTFGAVAGVALGSFAIMPNFGVTATNFVAAGMNFALAAAIFIFRKRLLGDSWKPGEKLEFLPRKKAEASEAAAEEKNADAAPEESDPDASDDIAVAIPKAARPAAMFAFAAGGLAALCYEVVWSRALAMTIGSSFHSFALILMTFLIGIAGGSAVASGALSRKRMFGTAIVTSVLLILVANAQWAIEDGISMWLAVSAFFALPVAIVHVVVRNAQANEARLGEAVVESGGDAAPAAAVSPWAPLAALCVPLLAAGFNGFGLYPGTLGTIIFAVVACLVLFTALMVGLRRYPMLQLAATPLFIALAAFVNYLYQDDVPCGYVEMLQTLNGQFADHVGEVRFFMFLIAGLCTLPATIGMGAMFPLTLRIWTSGGDSVGEDVGDVYAANTVGSILGAWLPGFVLISLVGIEKTILIGMWVYLGAALVLLIVSASESDDPDEAPPPSWYVLTVYILAPLIPALCAGLYYVSWRSEGSLRWSRGQITLGVFRVSLADDACSEDWGEPDIVYYQDGVSTTVSVERWGRHFALKNNGKVDASNGDDMPTQIMVAAYPLLMHEEGPEDLDVAVVGFGSGVSVGTSLRFPVKSVDVIELERSIPDASKFFADVNGLEYNLPEFPFIEMDRLTVINDDGRNYLASTDKQYDVIISEPSNPWITGVSDLFTTDHWRITKQRLRPGGIYCQWVQLYELSPENIKTIYRTFASQFEHVVVFAAEDLSSDTVILGSDSPLPLDLERIQEAYNLPGVATELGRAYVHSPFDIFSRVLMASKEEVLHYAQIEYRLRGGEWISFPDSSNPPDRGCTMPNCRREPAILNTDDNAHIEFAAPRDLIGFQRFEGYLANIYASDWPYGQLTENVTGFGEGEEGARNLAEMAMSLMAHGNKPQAATFITRSQDMGGTRETAIAAEILTRFMSPEGEPSLHIEEPVPGPQLAAQQTRELTEGFAAVRQAVDQNNYPAALAAMETIPTPLRLHSGPSLRLLYAYLLYKTAGTYESRYRDCIDAFEDLVRGETEYVTHHPEVFYFLGRAHDAGLNFDKAVRNMRVYVEARLRAIEARQLREAVEAEATAQEAEDAAEGAEAADTGEQDAGTGDAPADGAGEVPAVEEEASDVGDAPEASAATGESP